MATVFIFQPHVRAMSQAEEVAFYAATAHVDELRTATYTARQKRTMDELYTRFVGILFKEGFWQKYARNNPYLGGKRPTQHQAKHSLLNTYRYFVNVGVVRAEEAASFFWSELGAVEERRELLQAMYQTHDIARPPTGPLVADNITTALAEYGRNGRCFVFTSNNELVDALAPKLRTYFGAQVVGKASVSPEITGFYDKHLFDATLQPR